VKCSRFKFKRVILVLGEVKFDPHIGTIRTYNKCHAFTKIKVHSLPREIN
jgi:hypothetical protein